ncbi:MAG: flippase [Candidatus Omnitrophota bacterium]
MAALLKNSIKIFFSQVAILIGGIIGSIILARSLGPTGRGIYALLILFPTVMSQLCNFGIGEANVYFVGKDNRNLNVAVSISFLGSVAFSLVAISLLLTVSRFAFFQNFLIENLITPFQFWAAIAVLPLLLLAEYLKTIFLGKEEITVYNVINLSYAFIGLISIVVFVFMLGFGVNGALTAYILSSVTIAALTVILLRKIIPGHFLFSKKQLASWIKFGLKGYSGNLAQLLNYRLDMFLVALFLNPSAVGYYSIAVAFAEGLWMIPRALATALFPRISALSNAKTNGPTAQISRHNFFVIGVLSLLCALFVRPMIGLLFGDLFLPSAQPLLILLPGVAIFGGARVLASDLFGRGRPEFASFAAFLSLVINVALNLYLIPRWGISGAAFASTMAYSAAAALIFVAYKKISKESWKNILFIKKSDFSDYKYLLPFLRRS